MSAATGAQRKRSRCGATSKSPTVTRAPVANPVVDVQGATLRSRELIEGRAHRRESARRENELLNKIADLELSLQLAKKPCMPRPRRGQAESIIGARAAHAIALRQPMSSTSLQHIAGSPSNTSSHSSIVTVPVSNLSFRSVKNALIELLSDPAASSQTLTRFMQAFHLSDSQKSEIARGAWETLLDELAPDTVTHILSRMHGLRHHAIHCPGAVFRNYVQMEWIELLCDVLDQSQIRVSEVLLTMYAGMTSHSHQHFAASRAPGALQDRLIRRDMLLLAASLAVDSGFKAAAIANEEAKSVDVSDSGSMISSMLGRISGDRPHVWRIAHFARHGSLQELCAALSNVDNAPSRSAIVNSTIDGCPMLFQPLLECLPGWTDRLRVLVDAGADAGVVYQPWNCSALHMLCYRKPGTGMTALTRVDRDSPHSGSGKTHLHEHHLVRAAEHLLQHGAAQAIDRADRHDEAATLAQRPSRTPALPSKRTALIQAASDGRLQLCRTLLRAGAQCRYVDSHQNSCLDYLFYLKHSDRAIHRRASAEYSCIDIFGLVMEFDLHKHLWSAELGQSCSMCRACRWLFANVHVLDLGNKTEIKPEEFVEPEAEVAEIDHDMLIDSHADPSGL